MLRAEPAEISAGETSNQCGSDERGDIRLKGPAEQMERDNDGRGERKKRSGWNKVVDLILRSCHIGTASVLFGGLVWAVPHARLASWHQLTIATGSALIIFNIAKCRHWPYQGRGLAAALHISLLGLVHAWPASMTPVLMAVLAVGVVGSHMPAFLRHYSLVHRRILD